MKRIIAAVGTVGCLLSSSCGTNGQAEGTPEEPALETGSVESAVKLADAASLAHPEYDLAERTEDFVFFGSRPASEISDKMTENYRLLSINAASASLFNAALIRNVYPYERAGNEWQSGLTEAELLTIYADSTRRIVDLASYLDGGERRYAAVWLDNVATPIPYKIVLHETPANFVAAAQATVAVPLGWRVVDVETQPVPGDSTNYEVTGVMLENTDAATTRQQWFGYGPIAGTVPPPATPTVPTPMSVASGVSGNNARTADLSTPFGDGNFFWVAEENLDNTSSNPWDRPSSDCTEVDAISTERNWWFAEQRIEGADQVPEEEDVLRHLIFRYGSRTGKLKSYVSQAAGGEVRYLGVMYDNGFPGLPDGVPDPNPTNNVVVNKIDAAVKNRMKRWGIPGAALALTRGGQLVFAKGYGYSDLSSDPLRLTRADDSFRVASVSKAIAQSVLLRLINDDAVAKGVQQLDGNSVTINTRPFGQIFDGYTPPAVSGTCDVDGLLGTNDATGCTLGHITIRHLLDHTTGLLASGNQPHFGDDWPSAHTNDTWEARENFLRCVGGPLPCAQPSPFVARPGLTGPPGWNIAYLNTGYQIILDIIEELLPDGESYDTYLAEVTATIGLQRMRGAHLESAADPAPVYQAHPYSLPIPFCYGGAIPSPPEADFYVDQGPTQHTFLGSASISTSMVDLVRWATAVDGTRGGPRLFNASAFTNDFRGPFSPFSALPFEHGGLFNWNVQAIVRMSHGGTTTGNEVDFALVANGDSHRCGQEFCCPGTTTCNASAAALSCAGGATPITVFRYTHERPFDTTGLATFDVELRDDINYILNSSSCVTKLPTGDNFSDYLPTEPDAECKDAAQPAGPSCTATLTTSLIDAGSSGGTPMLTTGSTFGPGAHPVGLSVANSYGTSQCRATFTVTDETPPTLTPPPPVTTTACFDGSTVNIGQATASDNCAGTLLPTGFITSKNGVPVSPPVQVFGGQAFLTVGVYNVEWSTSDGTFPVTASQTVTVTADPTVPVVTAPANVTQKICQTSAVINVGMATATDNCPVTVTGQVVATNGVTLPTPITITGPVDLGVGTHTIHWTATDKFNTSAPVVRTATLNPTIEASFSYDVQDRAQIRATSGFAAVFNRGSNITHIGQDARTGAIFSVASVDIDQRAIVSGPVTSAGEIDVDPTASTGTRTEGATVVLPALPTLPAFPPASGGGFTVNSGTRNQAPGSYTNVSVNGGTLILGAGDYFFHNLTLNSNGTVRVSPNTRIFVRDSLVFNTPFRALSGTAIQPIYFGFQGTNLSLPIRFDGTLVAPNALVSFGSGPGVTFTGSFYVRRLQLNPASSLVCLP